MIYTTLDSLVQAANQAPRGDLEALARIQDLIEVLVSQGPDALISAQL